MTLKQKVADSIKWKQSLGKCADRLGITLERYKKLRAEVVKEATRSVLSESKDKLKPQKDKLIEQKVNVDKGTAELTMVTTSEPLTSAEVEKLFKIDRKQWRLSQYWNKEQADGTFRISALVTQVTAKDSVDTALLDKLVAKLSKITPYKAPKHTKSPYMRPTMVVYLSDRHTGARVENSIYDNTWNLDEHKKRLDKVINRIDDLYDTHGVFEEIILVDLGDKSDGQDGTTTRRSHSLPQNMDNYEMYDSAVEADKHFIDKLMQGGYAEKYRIVNVANSNHGGFMDYAIARLIEEYVAARYPEVETTILRNFLDHIYIHNHALILTHGKDDEDRKFGLPLNLDPKVKDYIQDYIRENQLDKYIVSVIKGDLHQANVNYCKAFRYKNVPSIFGSTKWMHNNFGVGYSGYSIDLLWPNDRIVGDYTEIFM